MSVERSFEAWEEVQRHGQDLADRLAQGFTDLIQTRMNPPQFAWPNPTKSNLEFPSYHSFGKRDFALPPVDDYGVSAIFDIGSRIGQAGVDFGASLNGMVQQFFRSLPVPVPFKHEEDSVRMVGGGGDNLKSRMRSGVVVHEDLGLGSLSEKLRSHGFSETVTVSGGGTVDAELGGFNLGSAGHHGRRQVIFFLVLVIDG